MTTPVSSVNPTAFAAAAQQAATNQPAASSAGSDRSALDPKAFLQLLVAQLQYQDPSKPVDTSAFMQQTATLSQVQTMNSMSSTLTALVTAQQDQAATGMIGKSVTYADSTGVQHTGVVSSAQLLATGATLKVGDADVPLAQVLGVSAAPSAASS
jgi:flagellar basal-body rod modification protein FlgD